MDSLRTREWVGLAGLALAVLIAMGFCNPANGAGDPVPIRLGDEVPPTSVPPTATPTPVPATDLPPADLWELHYRTSASPSRGVEDSFSFAEVLAIDHAAAPYAGLRDDDWSVRAIGTWSDLPEGRYAFSLLHDGALTVEVNGRVVREEPDPAAAETIRVAFDHPGGMLEVRLSGVDTGGPFQVIWQ